MKSSARSKGLGLGTPRGPHIQKLIEIERIAARKQRSELAGASRSTDNDHGWNSWPTQQREQRISSAHQGTPHPTGDKFYTPVTTPSYRQNMEASPPMPTPYRNEYNYDIGENDDEFDSEDEASSPSSPADGDDEGSPMKFVYRGRDTDTASRTWRQARKRHLRSSYGESDPSLCLMFAIFLTFMCGISLFLYHEAKTLSRGAVQDTEDPIVALRHRREMLLTDRVDLLTKDLEHIEQTIDGYSRTKHQEYLVLRDNIFKDITAARNGPSRFRSDGRCGPKYPAPGASEFGECDPTANADQKGPCCRIDSGYCGNEPDRKWGHCNCAECVNFTKVAIHRARMLAQLEGASEVAAVEAVVAAVPKQEKHSVGEPKANLPAWTANGLMNVSGLPRFRADGRCGPDFPAPGSPNFGECDPNADADQKGPCCRVDSGWCGNIRHKRWGHCPPACKDCIDYSKSNP